MKRFWINFGAALSLLLIWSAAAEAKWWIFGKSEEAVTIEYLYINQMAFEESDQEVRLFRQFLNNGMVEIRGKAKAAKGAIGAVKISLDDRKTWHNAKLAAGGNFEYQFRPEGENAYDFYVQAIDTTGRTNQVDLTHKVIQLTDQDMRALVKQVLDQMVRAYTAEDPADFMRHVSENFAGDELNLDYAIRRDFTFFDNIQLIATISNIAIGAKGNIHVSVSYSRSVVSTRSGRPLRDRGLTEFVFVHEDGGPKVYAMKYPLIFGLSDPANVATGVVVSNQNDRVLVVDDRGNAAVVPLEEAVELLESVGELGGDSDLQAPTNLRIDGGMAHHFVDLMFDSTIDPLSPQAMQYETATEEALSASGPWQEVDRRAFDTFVRLTTDNIASHMGFIYYRVRIVKTSSGTLSQPSNVVQLDNT